MMCKYNIEAGETFMQSRLIHILFPQGRNKALTFSYDDGRQEDRRLVSIFRKHGLKATSISIPVKRIQMSAGYP